MEIGEMWEEEDSLEVRRSRVLNKGSSVKSSSSSSSSSSTSAAAAVIVTDMNSEEEDSFQLKGIDSKTNGHMNNPSETVMFDCCEGQESVLLDESKEKDGPDDVLAIVVVNGGVLKETEITEEKEEQSKSNSSVYYDKDEGIWKCRVCCWTHRTPSLCIDLIQKPNGHLHQPMYCKTINSGGSYFNFEVAEYIKQNHGNDALNVAESNICDQKNLNSVVYHEQEGIKKNANLSITHNSEISPAVCVTSSSSSKVTEIETVGIEVGDESDLEGEELDVERVLQKQKTHDLYCPNCNSCITRRVILRKRKRRIHITGEDIKRNKLETVTDSKEKDIDNQTTTNSVPDTSNIHLDGTSELVANEYDREREPDIFRCLSCFSIFIPTGKGFKLFQLFGDKSKKTMEDQPIPSTVLSDRDRTIAQSVTGDTQKTSSTEDLLSSNNILHPVAEVKSDRVKASNSTVQQQLMPSAENVSYDANTKKKDAGDNVKKPIEVSSKNQLIPSNVSYGMEYLRGDQSPAASTNQTPAPEEHFQNDPVSVLQPDGLNLVISTDVVSITSDNSQNDQKSDLKIQQIHAGPCAGTESILPMPSEHKDRGEHGKATTQVGVFHDHEQNDGTMVPNFSRYENGTRDKVINNDGVHSYQPIAQTTDIMKVEIHGEPLKIDKDTLVSSVKGPILIHDKQSDTVRDLKMVIEHSGKDTVIVVETEPSKVTDSNDSAEIGIFSPQLTTGTDVAEQMGADAGEEAYEIEIIKSIVYGGLVESITSLGVVSSAAGGGTTTLNILALSMANLIGGLLLVGHNLWELKKYHVMEVVPNQQIRNIDRYKELLGRRENFVVHATVALLSFIVFGLISPITYAFSFRQSDDRDFKLFASAAASLLCIVLLATGKSYVRQPPKSYSKTVGYYVLLGVTASGISYAAGELIKRLLVKYHLLLLQSNSAFLISLDHMQPDASLWATS